MLSAGSVFKMAETNVSLVDLQELNVRTTGFETRRTATAALASWIILLVPRMCLGSFHISEAICTFLEKCILMSV